MRRTYYVILAGLSIGLAVTVFAWCRPQSVIRQARADWLVLAGLLFAASLVLWSGVWASMLRRACHSNAKEQTCADGGLPKDPSFLPAFSVSMASLFGLTTPLNLGSDALRVWYARRYLGLGSTAIIGASLVTRELKLHLTFPLVLCAVLCPLAGTEWSKAWVALAGLSLLEALLRVMRAAWARPLMRRLRVEAYAQSALALCRELSPGHRIVFYSTFGLAFFLEWLALVTALQALDLKLPLPTSAWLYVWLYLLSRTPFSFQGIGVVEVGGLVALTAAGLAPAQAGALLVLWAAIRLVTPLSVSAIFAAWLAASSRPILPGGALSLGPGEEKPAYRRIQNA